MQPQLRRRALDVAGVVEVGLERQHELLVAAVEQPAQAGRDVVERRRRAARSAAGRRAARPSGRRPAPRSSATRSAASARRCERGRLAQLADRRRPRRRGRWPSSPREATLRSASASCAPRIDACAPTMHVARPPISPQSACLTGTRARKRSIASCDRAAGADADDQRPRRHVVVGLEHRGGGRRGARVGREQRGDQLLLAAAAVELGVGLGLQDRRPPRAPRRGRAAARRRRPGGPRSATGSRAGGRRAGSGCRCAPPSRSRDARGSAPARARCGCPWPKSVSRAASGAVRPRMLAVRTSRARRTGCCRRAAAGRRRRPAPAARGGRSGRRRSPAVPLPPPDHGSAPRARGASCPR